MNVIHQALPRKQAENQTHEETRHESIPAKHSPGFGTPGAQGSTPTRDLGQMEKELLKREYGEKFAMHYHAAAKAASAIAGQEFLDQYRALQRTAREQGMSESDFRRFEKCLYRNFYRSAALDVVRSRQAGTQPKVKPHELAYIAKVADISEEQIQRDSLTFQKCELVAQIRTLRSRTSHA